MRKSSPPTITPDPNPGDPDQKRYTHPAYGIVQVSRCSGHTELFDSAFIHQHYISLKIREVEKITDGSHTFLHPRKELIEVLMSEAQFARAITSMNLGSGSPCTIARIDGKMIDSPEAEDLQKSHTDMVREKLNGQLNTLKMLGNKIAAMRERKQRPTLKQLDEMSTAMDRISSQFSSNMGYYAQCMEEHMEATVSSAKAEIEVHLMTSAHRLGIPQDEVPQLQLGGSRHDEVVE